MASTYDEFLTNFDLNQFGIEETVQPNYEKLRKTTHLLKKKIISTDFVVQRYLAKTEDYNQALKAHLLTKEDLKQACINYKNSSERCLQLEHDIKLSQANQEALEKRATEAETKYDALLSYSNQIQALIQELKTENEALVIEKNLDGNSSKVLQLQKEKEVLHKTILALQDVIQRKKKKGKQHVKILKADKKDTKIFTSDESADEAGSQSSYCRKKSHKINDLAVKDSTLNLEPDFIDNDSDTCNEEVSIDTGRGSSCANSVKNDLSSPEHYNFEPPLQLTDNGLVKHVEVATSPITVHESVSVSTSPIIFDSSVSLFEDLHKDAINHCDEKYTVYAIIDEKNNLVDSCTSPISLCSELNKLIEVGTSPIKELINEDIKKPTAKSLFSDLHEYSKTQQIEVNSEHVTCLCKKSDVIKIKKTFVDVCTSPISKCHPEINTSDEIVYTENSKNCHKILGKTAAYYNINDKEITEFTRSCCDKFTSTENVTGTEKNFVDACTSPVLKSIDNCQIVDSISPVCVFDWEEDTQNENSYQELNLESSVARSQMHKSVGENETLNPMNSTQTFNNNQEKICLENNNSMNVCYDTKDDDAEVQNILSMMKFGRNFISPLPDSPPTIPFNSNYLNMHIKNIYDLIEKCNNNIKIVHNNVEEIKKRDSASFQNSISEIVDTESINVKRHQCKNTNMQVNQEKVEEEEDEEEYISDIIVLSNKEKCNTSDGYVGVLGDSSYLTPSVRIHNPLTEIPSNNTAQISELNKVVGIPVTDSNTYRNNQQHNDQILHEESFEDGEVETVKSLENTLNANNNISDIKKCDQNECKRSNPKSKSKSKLQKLRDKMLPISKIKKTVPAIPKNVSKALKKMPREITSPSVQQRIAYEKAVQVINELKSGEKFGIQSKTKLSTKHGTEGAGSDITLNKVESPFSSNVISTRSRTSKLNEKEYFTAVTVSPKKLPILEKNTSDIEASPSRRKTRKRPADNTLDSLQNSRKRSLRSANDDIIFSTIRIEIEPSDDDMDFKARNENLNSLVGLGKEIYIYPGDSQCEINSIDHPNDEEDDKRLIITPNHDVESVESNHISDLMVDKSDKSVEKDQSLRKQHISDQPVASLNNNKVEENVKQSLNNNKVEENVKQNNNCSSINANILEPLTDNNVNLSEQAEESRILNSSENVGPLRTVQEDEKNLKQTYIQKGSNSLNQKTEEKTVKMTLNNPVVELTSLGNDGIADCNNRIVSYSDLDIYSIDSSVEETVQNVPPNENQHIKENILCAALERYGVNKVKLNAKKIPETITNTINQKIEQSIADTIASPKDHQKDKMNQLIHSIQGFKTKHILAGLMKYLKDPTRKCELFNTVNNGSAPPMTRSEVILLYVIEHLNVFLLSQNFIQNIYANIEHALFQLNHSPSFETIESMSHFYAVMCRYFRNKSRLRCFMLDAMYCLQFKAVPLIKQCLEVCPGVLPFAHEHMAKTSLVTCLVYLLHFYKCTDKYNRVQEIRTILCRKYHYRFSEWNETMILEIFRKAIMNLRDMNNDKKMLRLALIILCKRHGANWCQTKIIQNMLLPIIQEPAVPEKIKQFCVLMLGPLLKPFPADKKAQCEIVINQLLLLLKNNPSHEMQEAVYSSLIFMSKHDQERVVQALLSWNPGKVSNDFEEILNDYVMDRPLSVWKKLVTKPSQCT